MKIAICGMARSGKTTASKWITENTSLRYSRSTSEAAAQLVYDTIKASSKPCWYRNVRDAWNDRVNRRAQWARIIWDYNQPSGTRLYEEMLEQGEDILDGIRKSSELKACRDLLDLSIWISRPNTHESNASCEIQAVDCDITIHNNGTLEELNAKLHHLCKDFEVVS